MLAFTLSRTDYREYDQLVAFFTSELGKVELVARGIKKITSKNAPALEPFSLLEIEVIPGKNSHYVTKSQIIENYFNIRNDLEKISSAGFILNFIKNVSKNSEPDQKIFNLINSFFKFLDKTSEVKSILVVAFIGRAGCFMGFTPILTRCAICSSKIKKTAFFSPADGGIICEICARKINYSSLQMSVKTISGLHAILTKNWDKLSQGVKLTAAEIAEISEVIKKHIEYHLGFQVNYPNYR